ncbi:hypothetical protein GCM10011346_05940 [Oceanobacillus neutriphilus]|uniref:Uncharacterized protein n=1 Tax=Oceanobacillus neutriphilus TaxID=531815 RepID=A0ABQ2NQ35_9BACI|nr:hypothetical protein GCM10011346_05940 [Oceanobacillus neutriphilus]
MVIYFNVVKGYLDGWSSTSEGFEYKLEVENTHEVLINPFIFKFENGELIKDEEYQKQLIGQEEIRKSIPNSEEINAIAILELAEMVFMTKRSTNEKR